MQMMVPTRSYTRKLRAGKLQASWELGKLHWPDYRPDGPAGRAGKLHLPRASWELGAGQLERI